MAATLTQLRDRARYRGDFESDANITNTILTVWANEAIQELWDIVAAAFQDHSLSATTVFALTGGSVANSQLTLASSVYLVRLLEKHPDTPARFEVPPYQLGQKNSLSQLSYRVHGGILQVEPYELAAGNYKLHYLATPTALAADGDTLDTRLWPFEEFVSLSMAIKACMRQERPCQDLQMSLEAIRQRARSMAAMRNSGRPAITRDVYAEGLWPYWYTP